MTTERSAVQSAIHENSPTEQEIRLHAQSLLKANPAFKEDTMGVVLLGVSALHN
jgi:predicted nucleotide-binding protein (sugar kinase/HSP70/actin superfamily)